MKKNSICRQGGKPSPKARKIERQITIGMDLGDKTSCYCVLDSNGDIVKESSVAMTKKAIAQRFGAMKQCRIAVEAGTHSAWVSRLLSGYGHQMIVANARQVKLISHSSRKNDRVDARTLARLARVDPELLRPIRHRSEQAQEHLLAIRVRAALLESRTALVNAARGLVKVFGERLPACDADQMRIELLAELPAGLRRTLQPLIEEVESLTQKIKTCDRSIEQIAREHYPETELLQQISGVGTLIALTFVLTVEDPWRFQKSRDVGCYVGLRPRRSESGESQPQLRITKEGDRYLRAMLVQGAHYIMGWRGPDTDLRTTGEVYEPLRNSQARQPRVAAA